MEKMVVYLILTIGTVIGGYLPVLLGQDPFGLWSLFGATVGGFASIVVIYKLKQAGYQAVTSTPRQNATQFVKSFFTVSMAEDFGSG